MAIRKTAVAITWNIRLYPHLRHQQASDNWTDGVTNVVNRPEDAVRSAVAGVV